MTNHVWAGFHVSFNLAAWKKLPPDLQEIVHRQLHARRRSRNAQDFVTMTQTEQQNLTGKGLTFNTPDIEAVPRRAGRRTASIPI